MYKLCLFIAFLVLSFENQAQKKVTPLPSELIESSALIKCKKTFLSLNDSGNESIIYVFNKKGEIKHSCFIDQAKNVDWEAMTYDGKEFLYIADIGNNANKRKDLAIYKVKIAEVLNQDTAKAKKIVFHYPEQKEFPPKESALYYDAEALVLKQNDKEEDELLIFTKNRTVPFDGISKVYALPTQTGKHEAKLISDLHLLPTNWREESITDATLYKDELYLLTYSKVYKMKWEDEKWVEKKVYEHDSWTQKEGIAVDHKFIYMTDENKMGIFTNNYLYKLKK